MIGSYLILATVIVGVQYWLVSRKMGTRMMGYVFLAGGLLVLFATSPLVFVLFKRIPRLGQMTAQSGAFVALMGMLHLFTRRDQ